MLFHFVSSATYTEMAGVTWRARTELKDWAKLGGSDGARNHPTMVL